MKHQLFQITAFVSTAIAFTTLRADEPSLGTLVGLAKTFYNTAAGFVGSTTVTPHYALHHWRRSWWGTYRDQNWNQTYKCDRSLVTGAYVYTTDEINWSTSGSSEVHHSNPFILNNLAKWNYRCDRSVANPDGTVSTYLYNGLETFTLAVWAGSVVKTGFFPTSGPYEVWIKQIRTPISGDCNPPVGASSPYIYATMIAETGTQFASPGYLNHDYNWVPRVWIGGPWDY